LARWSPCRAPFARESPGFWLGARGHSATASHKHFA
jgi:hypothetical protein